MLFLLTMKCCINLRWKKYNIWDSFDIIMLIDPLPVFLISRALFIKAISSCFTNFVVFSIKNILVFFLIASTSLSQLKEHKYGKQLDLHFSLKICFFFSQSCCYDIFYVSIFKKRFAYEERIIRNPLRSLLSTIPTWESRDISYFLRSHTHTRPRATLFQISIIIPMSSLVNISFSCFHLTNRFVLCSQTEECFFFFKQRT